MGWKKILLQKAELLSIFQSFFEKPLTNVLG